MATTETQIPPDKITGKVIINFLENSYDFQLIYMLVGGQGKFQ